MAKLDIIEFPDPRLRIVAKPIAVVDSRVQKLADDMLETMYAAPGIGLSGTQVNVHERIIVVDVSEDQNEPYVFINPELELLGNDIDYPEGCLSVPGYFEEVTRKDHIRVHALNREGEAFSMEAHDLFAICIQHECDHLAGKLFVDYLSTLKRNRIRRKLEKAHRAPA